MQEMDSRKTKTESSPNNPEVQSLLLNTQTPQEEKGKSGRIEEGGKSEGVGVGLIKEYDSLLN